MQRLHPVTVKIDGRRYRILSGRIISQLVQRGLIQTAFDLAKARGLPAGRVTLYTLMREIIRGEDDRSN